MGMLSDLAMPVGLSFVGRAYDDANLLACAYAYEQLSAGHQAPPRTPALPSEQWPQRDRGRRGSPPPTLQLHAELSPVGDDGMVEITVTGTVINSLPLTRVEVAVNGQQQVAVRDGANFGATLRLPFDIHYTLHSRWRGPYGSIVSALIEDAEGGCAAAYVVVGGLA
jgi:amidase